MNEIKPHTVAGVIFLSIFTCSAIPAAYADVKDLGHVCISLSLTGSGLPPLAEKYGVLAYGPSLQYMVLANANRQQHGSAVLSGDQIFITLNDAALSPDSALIVASLTQITLNVSTLRGTFTRGFTSPPQEPQTRNITGTAEAIPCN